MHAGKSAREYMYAINFDLFLKFDSILSVSFQM